MALVAGFATLQAYENRPCAAGFAAARWPTGAWTFRAQDRPTIVVFAHPRCPCTEATVEELDRLIARIGPAHAAVQIYFYCPEDAPDSFSETTLRRRAERIPGAQVGLDRGGRIAEGFGAATSGQVLVYEPGGRLQFRGGITGSRGHAGRNRGVDAVEEILLGIASSEIQQAPVFGCDLQGSLTASPSDPTPRSSTSAGSGS